MKSRSTSNFVGTLSKIKNELNDELSINQTEKLSESKVGKLADFLASEYIEFKGKKFRINSTINSLKSCMEYDYSDLRSSDIVLDLGACCGAFSILVSDRVNKIYAVEPLFSDLILENLFLNKIYNIFILPYALAPTSCWLHLRYDPRINTVPARPFEWFLDMPNIHFDFLKMDVEMAEWCITSDNLRDFRRLEIEVHNFDGKHNIENFETIVKNAGFEYITDTIKGSPTHIIHGFNKGIK